MEIQEFLNKKRQLETKIRQLLNAEISKFRDETGINVNDITLHIERTRTVSEEQEKSIICYVKIDTKLE